MYFRKYELRKTRLDKCPKNRVSEDAWTSNMVKGPKHCCNADDGSFTIFIDHCYHNSFAKSLPQCYEKS